MEFASADAPTTSVPGAHAMLSDFDWSLRLVLSSSKLSGLRTPLVMLKLDRVRADGSIEEKMIEMDESELDSFISSLQKAQKAIVRD